MEVDVRFPLAAIKGEDQVFLPTFTSAIKLWLAGNAGWLSNSSAFPQFIAEQTKIRPPAN
jgi:hypothetical protein